MNSIIEHLFYDKWTTYWLNLSAQWELRGLTLICPENNHKVTKLTKKSLRGLCGFVVDFIGCGAQSRMISSEKILPDDPVKRVPSGRDLPGRFDQTILSTRLIFPEDLLVNPVREPFGRGCPSNINAATITNSAHTPQ